jgi:outer membrane protein assembly factor BamB
MNLLHASIAVLASVAILAVPSRADDWPQWRGPNRDGVWRETGVIEKFDADKLEGGQIPIKWRVEIGSGYSGPTVANGRVYVTDRVTQPEQGERVHCFDEQTGEKVWSHEYRRTYAGVGYVAGPRACVTIDDGRAYALGTMGDFHCFDAKTGDIVWKKDLNEEYQIQMPIWGIAAAPLIEGELVIVQIGGKGACLVAFDRKTGEERWKALDDRTSYAAPLMIEQAGQRVLVCWTGDNVVGLNPQTGKAFWKHPFKPNRMVIAISTPVVDAGRLFVTSFYDGSLLLKLDGDKPAVEQVWRRQGTDEMQTDALHSIIATPLIQGDYIYGVDSYGELRCLEAATGDRVWEDLTAAPNVRWGNIHMTPNGDKVWMFNEAGDLIISRLSPDGFEEISRARLIEPTEEQLRGRRGPDQTGVCWAHPAYANKHVFARNDKELVCASLEK